MSMFDGCTDVHICGDKPRASIAFPGPHLVREEDMADAEDLLQRCQTFDKHDFMVSVGDCFFRGRRETRSVDGVWYRLRRMPSVPPTLSTLPSPLPPAVQSMLSNVQLQQGGLVYVCGAAGSGKTTTASATVVSRLQKLGGFAYTVEDPPEMPLNGWHNNGYCAQTWVAGDTPEHWAESFRAVLRSQPVGTPSMLYVGEVRDSQSAQALLRAAGNGFLVIATGFGTDLLSGIESLMTLAGGQETVADPLSNLLRLVIHQRLVNGSLIATALASANGSTSVATRLRNGQLQQIQNDIQFQANQMRLGNDPMAAHSM